MLQHWVVLYTQVVLHNFIECVHLHHDIILLNHDIILLNLNVLVMFACCMDPWDQTDLPLNTIIMKNTKVQTLDAV